MSGRHSTQNVSPGLRRLGAVALTTTALAGATGAGLAGVTGTALAAPTADTDSTEKAGSQASSVVTGQGIVAEARKHLGKPYVYGADGPSSFDCSGLTQYVLGTMGIDVPRTASAQQDAVESVSRGEMQPGDLIFQGSSAHHVAIYAGAGKMITAPESGQDVKIDDLPSTFTAGRAS